MKKGGVFLGPWELHDWHIARVTGNKIGVRVEIGQWHGVWHVARGRHNGIGVREEGRQFIPPLRVSQKEDTARSSGGVLEKKFSTSGDALHATNGRFERRCWLQGFGLLIPLFHSPIGLQWPKVDGNLKLNIAFHRWWTFIFGRPVGNFGMIFGAVNRQNPSQLAH